MAFQYSYQPLTDSQHPLNDLTPFSVWLVTYPEPSGGEIIKTPSPAEPQSASQPRRVQQAFTNPREAGKRAEEIRLHQGPQSQESDADGEWEKIVPADYGDEGETEDLSVTVREVNVYRRVAQLRNVEEQLVQRRGLRDTAVEQEKGKKKKKKGSSGTSSAGPAT